MAERIPAGLSAAEGRKFAFTLGCAFLALSGVFWWRGRQLPLAFALSVGVALFLGGIFLPTRMGPVQRAWMGLAHLMSRVTTPVFLGIVYFVAITGVGWLKRIFGRDSLALPPGARSAWITRPVPARRSAMDHQF